MHRSTRYACAAKGCARAWVFSISFADPIPIRNAEGLAEFIDKQAAFVVQKGIYEYSRARAGHYAKVLFKEPEFQAACDVSRWQAYPIGLVMVAELVEGVLRPLADGDEDRGSAKRLHRARARHFRSLPGAGGDRPRRMD